MGLWGRYRHGNTGKGRFATIPFLFFYNKFPSINFLTVLRNTSLPK